MKARVNQESRKEIQARRARRIGGGRFISFSDVDPPLVISLEEGGRRGRCFRSGVKPKAEAKSKQFEGTNQTSTLAAELAVSLQSLQHCASQPRIGVPRITQLAT